jgi:hypothetical protein
MGWEREGVPRRAEKNFYLYVTREGKEAPEHLSGPLRASKGLSSLLGAQTGACMELRSAQFSFLDLMWAIKD